MGKSQKEIIEAIETRRKIVKECCIRALEKNEEIDKKSIQEEIKQKLGIKVSSRTIDRDMQILREQGEIGSTEERQKKKIETIGEIIKEYYDPSVKKDKAVEIEKIQEKIRERLEIEVSEEVILEEISFLEEQEKKIREIVKECYKQSKTKQKIRIIIQEKIKEELEIEVTIEEISKQISFLKRRGELDENLIKETTENYNQQVENLYKQGIELKKIAEILEISQKMVNYIKNKLKKEGKITKSLLYFRQKRQKRVGELYFEQKKSVEDIMQELGINYKEIKEVILEDIEHIQNIQKTEELYNKGIELKKIAEILEVSPSMISYIKNKLIEQGKITEDIGTIIERRREKVEELYFEQEKSVEDIMKELGITYKEVILEDIEYVRNLRELEDLCFKQNKTIQEIAVLLNTSPSTVSKKLKERKEKREKVNNNPNNLTSQKETAQQVAFTKEEKGEESTKEVNTPITKEEIENLMNAYLGQPELIEKFDAYILDCKTRVEAKTFTKDELETLEDLAELTKKPKYIIFVLELYTRYAKFGRAVQFANATLEEIAFSEEEKQEVEKIKGQCQSAIKAISILEKQQGVEKAAEESKLPINYVKKLNRMVERRREKKRKEEQNQEEQRGA